MTHDPFAPYPEHKLSFGLSAAVAGLPNGYTIARPVDRMAGNGPDGARGACRRLPGTRADGRISEGR